MLLANQIHNIKSEFNPSIIFTCKLKWEASNIKTIKTTYICTYLWPHTLLLKSCSSLDLLLYSLYSYQISMILSLWFSYVNTIWFSYFYIILHISTLNWIMFKIVKCEVEHRVVYRQKNVNKIDQAYLKLNQSLHL